MATNEVPGAQLAMHYLAALVETPGGRAVFCAWAFDHQAELWREFARTKGRSPDDPVLAQDAVLAAQGYVIAGVQQELDKMGAVFEARQIIDGGSEVV
jgi:hypothetical protein